MAPSPAGQDPGGAKTGPSLGTTTVTLSSPRKSTPFCDEFYQLLSNKDDVDLDPKLAEWECFYNFSRPHGAFNGRASYEILRERL
jgi:hypothetical protein